MNRSEEAFAIHKAPHIAEAIVKNARLVTRENHLGASGALDHRPAAIIGAGHTLPDDLGDLRMCHIAVNSALGAMMSRGVTPDYLVVRESIDMSEQVRKLGRSPTIAYLDVGTHPATVAAAYECCKEVRWCIPASTQTFGLAVHLGIEPVYGGQSNVTLAVAIAAREGAPAIHLYGCSRAFSAEGRAYADGTGWESVRLESVTPVDDHHVGHIVGTECKERIHLASGQRPPLKHERVVPLTAVDGSTRWALEPLEPDRQWLENFAARHPHLELHQHNPDVAIAGWGHAPRKTLEPESADLVADMHAQVEHALAVSKAVREGGSLWEVPRMLEGSPIVDYQGIGSRILTMQAMRGRSPAVMVPALYRTTDEAAERVRGWL